MKLTKGKKRRVHEIMVDDWLFIAGKLFRVYKTQLGYCDHTKICLMLIDPSDPMPVTTLLLPRHYKLKVHNQKS